MTSDEKIARALADDWEFCGDLNSLCQLLRAEVLRLRAELAASICHGQSWKTLCEKYKEVADARGEALDMRRQREKD